MLQDKHLPTHPAIGLTARILFTSLFFLSGLTHFTNVPYYIDLMPEEIPFAILWIYLSGVVELVGAAMILVNWQPRLGAWLIVLFMVPVTFAVHGYEMLFAETELERAAQQAHFLKGIALTGAALLITQVGIKPARPLSAPRPSS
nr:DoxX family protein [Hyphomonas sp. Mor2]